MISSLSPVSLRPPIVVSLSSLCPSARPPIVVVSLLSPVLSATSHHTAVAPLLHLPVARLLVSRFLSNTQSGRPGAHSVVRIMYVSCNADRLVMLSIACPARNERVRRLVVCHCILGANEVVVPAVQRNVVDVLHAGVLGVLRVCANDQPAMKQFGVAALRCVRPSSTVRPNTRVVFASFGLKRVVIERASPPGLDERGCD